MTSGLLQFNKKHDISGKTASFLKAGATKVSEINTKYHVTENVSSATKTAVGVVKDTNEKCVAITHREGGAGTCQRWGPGLASIGHRLLSKPLPSLEPQDPSIM